jgi:transcriptional accessory protein Tex/SPT6
VGETCGQAKELQNAINNVIEDVNTQIGIDENNAGDAA